MKIEAKEIDSYYRDIKILENINISAERGIFMGIIGPNGSGKTTLLRSISRTLKPKMGVILLNEKDIYAIKSREVARNLAVVPQNQEMNFAFTAIEIVLMGRTPHLGRFEMENIRDMEIAEKAMRLTNTWHLANRRITEISGGERQRIIIAKALTQKPKILLLDEPTSHLDINYQIETLDLFSRLTRDDGLIVIAVFHDLNLAAQYCDELILLDKGRIYTSGKPEDVITSKNIESVYGIKVIVKQDSGRLIIHPQRKSVKPCKGRIHVICGAGTATFLMNSLVNQGYKVTAGVLNQNDTDYDAARMLGIEIVEEKPFSNISDKKYLQNLELIMQAEFVVITDIPFGNGNLHNLEAAMEAINHGIPVVMINGGEIKERDFTDGKATRLYNLLKTGGSIIVKNYLEIIEVLEKLEKNVVRNYTVGSVN